MRRMLIQSFPNREIRVTLTREASPKAFSYETHESQEKTDDVLVGANLSFAQNSRTPSKGRRWAVEDSRGKPGYGGLQRNHKFSVYGRRKLLQAGGALEQSYPHHECLFLTVTHPGSIRDSFEAIARWSGRIVKLLHDWIGNHIQSKLSLYTWEWQKRGALHLHYVVHCPSIERGEWIKANLQAEWIRILDKICLESGVDLYAKNKGFSWKCDKSVVRVDAQWCEKSVAAYLSKYVSKASDNNLRMPPNAFCPSRWYGVSRPLLALVREKSHQVVLSCMRDRDGLAQYENYLSLLMSTSIKCYEYRHKVGDGKTLVSYVISSEQDSIWTAIMEQTNHTQDSSSSVEQSIRRQARNGCILMRKHTTWLREFMAYYAGSRPASLLNLPSYKDISRNDLVFLVDALAYAYRSHHRTRFELSGECKLWYSKMKETLEVAPQSDREWIGALKL